MDFFERQELEDNNEEQAAEEGLNRDREGTARGKERSLKRPEKPILPKVTTALSAFTEINPLQDWAHFLIITFSVVADWIGSSPYLGAVMGIFFSIVFYVLYFLTGELKNRTVAKVVISGLAYFLESVGGVLLISFLPLFTVSASVIYWVELSYRKENKKQQDA